jgi:hypothetical protein
MVISPRLSGAKRNPLDVIFPRAGTIVGSAVIFVLAQRRRQVNKASLQGARDAMHRTDSDLGTLRRKLGGDGFEEGAALVTKTSTQHFTFPRTASSVAST